MKLFLIGAVLLMVTGAVAEEPPSFMMAPPVHGVKVQIKQSWSIPSVLALYSAQVTQDNIAYLVNKDEPLHGTGGNTGDLTMGGRLTTICAVFKKQAALAHKGSRLKFVLEQLKPIHGEGDFTVEDVENCHK